MSSNNNAANAAAPAAPATPTGFNYAAAAAKSSQTSQASSQVPSRTATPNNGTKPPVSMAKAAALGSAPSDDKIKFGAANDANAALSSSPAVQPKSGEHLQGDKPALFGSVDATAGAAADSKQKTVGFGGANSGNGSAAAATPAAGAAPPARRAMDFQKLFQSGGNQQKKPVSATNGDGAAASPATAAAPSPSVAASASPASRPASIPAAAQGAPFTPAAGPPSAGPSPSPAAPSHPAAQAPPFHPGQQQQQQQRSPMPAGAMPHMIPAGQWQGGGHPQHGHAPPFYAQQHQPQQQQQQQVGFSSFSYSHSHGSPSSSFHHARAQTSPSTSPSPSRTSQSQSQPQPYLQPSGPTPLPWHPDGAAAAEAAANAAKAATSGGGGGGVHTRAIASFGSASPEAAAKAAGGVVHTHALFGSASPKASAGGGGGAHLTTSFSGGGANTTSSFGSSSPSAGGAHTTTSFGLASPSPPSHAHSHSPHSHSPPSPSPSAHTSNLTATSSTTQHPHQGYHPQHHPQHPAHHPQHHPHQLGMGRPPPPPGPVPHSPAGYHAHPHAPQHHPSGSFNGGVGAPSGHAPSHSFGGGPGPGPLPMSPAARQFEPSPMPQKRMSSAIRIVNPDTKQAVDIKSPAAKPASAAPAASSSSPAGSPAPAHAAAPSPKPAAAAAPAPPASSSSPAPAPATPTRGVAATAAASTPSPFTPAKITTAQSFQDQVQARIAAANARKKQEAEAAAAAANAEADKKRAADAEAAKKREDEERAAADKKQKDDAEAEAKAKAAAEAAARKEREAKAAAQAQEAAAREKDAAEAAVAQEQKRKQDEARQAESVKADAAVDASAATSADATEAKLAAQEAVHTDEKRGEDAGKDAVASVAATKSVADIERMAREASASIPSTPVAEPGVQRTPLFPTTPRTPGTPGFAGLPAKPMASGGAGAAAATTANGAAAANFTLDGASLESRRRPSHLDTAAAQRAATPAAAANDTPVASTSAATTATTAATPSAAAAGPSTPPVSAASASLGSARFIDDINKVTYPDTVQSPKKELNASAEPGKFKYDRDFLLQFMGVFSEKPQDMPALASIGMEQGQMGGGGRAGSGGRRASGMAPGGGRGGVGGGLGLGLGGGAGGFGRGGPGAGGMGQFSHPAKTSEERFAQAQAAGGRGGGPAGGAFGSSGPMGSFAGGRTQPLSRGGSGSGALPSRDMMGTGTPAGGRTQSRRGRTREPGGGRGGDRVNPPEKGGPTIPMDQVVPLANSDNRWQAGSGQKLAGDSPELIQRKVKALLNKLTIEKFASISDQILEYANRSTEETDGSTLRLVIALIFEKATDEAAWSEMYAQLCRKLMERVSNDVMDESIKTADGQAVTGGGLFRKYLLTRCQVDFERGWAHRDAMIDAAKGKEAEDKAKRASNEKAEAEAKEADERGEKAQEKEAELMSDEYYAAQKAKRRGLGLVRFIGELYKLQMLTERIMHACIKKLLHNTKDPEEEEIESLCKLMTTVGAQLDTERARNYMDIYIARMREMNNSDAVNSRMKFMLLDVIELRAAGWKGSKQSAGPKSIAQIHEDAARAKQQAEAEMAARTGSGRGMPPSRGGSRRGQPRDFPQQMGHDGWTAVGSGNAPPPPRPSRAGDMSGFGKIERSGSGRPLSLGMGPNNVFAKKQAKTSEDGSKPPSRTSSSANMFEMLAGAQAQQAAQAAGGSGAGAGGAGAAGGDAAPAERPKLKLAPRTKPVDGGDDDEEEEDEEAGEGEGEGDATSADAPSAMDDETASRKITNDIKEFLEIRDVNEGTLAMKSLPASRRPEFIGKMSETAVNKKEDDVRTVGKLFASARRDSLVDDAGFVEGFKAAGIEMLDDISIDVPGVYKFMAVLVVASGLPEGEVETLAGMIEGEGLKSPKDRFLEKVKEERAAQA